MKVIFDIAKSKELCPPIYYPKGVTHVKRIVLKRNNVTYAADLNSRELHVQTNEVGPLITSFTVNGFIHTQRPPTIKVDPNNPDRFLGLSGYHRNHVAELLGWDTMIYDVLEFDTPLDERKWRTTSNHHLVPAISMTENDIIKQIKEAIECKEIANNDTEIQNFIDVIAADKTVPQRKKIFKNLRLRVSDSSTLRSYHSKGGVMSAQEFAIKHNLPFEGDLRYEQTNKLGYFNHSPTPKTSLFGAKKNSMLYGKPVYFYTWIKEPKAAPALYEQRKIQVEKFKEFIKEDCLFIQHMAKKCGKDLELDNLIENHPFLIGGFMDQDISPCVDKSGGPKEDGVVDVYGNPVIV